MDGVCHRLKLGHSIPFICSRKKSLRVHCESGIWIQPISKPIHCDGTLDF